MLPTRLGLACLQSRFSRIKLSFPIQCFPHHKCFSTWNQYFKNRLLSNYLMILVRGNKRILVPISLRRSVFWAAHFPAHQGLSQALNVLKKKHYFQNGITSISKIGFLSCVCAKTKMDKSNKKAHSTNFLKSERVLQI